jgi:aspartyl-tRNA(Asn)/glutamyl-tRNA(Gln) amidotransferase subunit C
MADALTRQDVERIAALASLALTEAEVDTFTRQLGDILTYARQVQQLDTAGVSPTSHVLTGAPVERPDAPAPSIDRTTALAQAPDAAIEEGLFRVPRVIG